MKGNYIMFHYNIKEYTKCFDNLYDTLKVSAEKRPDKVAVIDDSGSYTYSQLKIMVDNMANTLLKKYSMKKNEQIAFFMVNSIHMVVSFYATMKIGCVAVMLNTKFSSCEIEEYLKDMDAKLIISDSEWLDKFDKVPIAKKCRGIITEKTNIDPMLSSEDIPANASAGDTAVIMHTSATTGNPKGILITHANILEASYGYVETQGIDSSVISVLSAPIFHILGLSCVTTMIIYLGGTLVLTRKYKTDVVLKLIKEYKATHFHSVPSIYLDIMHSDSPDKDLSSIKTLVCGGAHISDEDMIEFCKLAPNAVFRKAYGMTETAGSGTLSHTHCGPLEAVPNMHITVVDEELNEVPTGTIGEIVFCGPCCALGRWKMKSFDKPYIYSGDIGYMDEKGGVYIIDRKKDIINRGGEKIFPKEIEDVILKYPGIEKAVVYAVSDKYYGEVPYSAIILKENACVDVNELNLFLKKYIAKYKMPVKFIVVNSFPTTHNGKVKKRKLREYTEKGEIGIWENQNL